VEWYGRKDEHSEAPTSCCQRAEWLKKEEKNPSTRKLKNETGKFKGIGEMEKTALLASHLGTISMKYWLIDLYCPGEIEFPSAHWPKTRVEPFVIQDARPSSDLFSCMRTYTYPIPKSQESAQDLESAHPRLQPHVFPVLLLCLQAIIRDS